MRVLQIGCLALSLGLALPALAHAEIRIAVAGPMKGQFGEIGEQMRAGAAQAIADLNSAGGVLGESLSLEVADDGCSETGAVAVANQLIGKEAQLVIGHVCFGASIPASEIYAEAGIIQISPATTLPEYSDFRPKTGVYRLAPRDDEQAKVAAQLLLEEFNDRKIAFLHDKTAYGKSLVDAVKQIVNDNGLTESLYEGFDAGGSDYRALVSRLSLEGIDAVYLGGYHPEAGLIKLEMASQGLNAVLIAGDALITDEYWAVTGNAGEGTLLTYPLDPRELPEARSLVAAFAEAGQPAERYALASYAAVQAWVQAVEAVQSIEPGAVAEALDSEEFFTILGDFSFNGQGDAGLPGFAVHEWRDGTPVVR